ncbi:hypothetical protein F4677DRAFT_427811, partial [Hypoxylon crocopeplum]
MKVPRVSSGSLGLPPGIANQTELDSANLQQNTHQEANHTNNVYQKLAAIDRDRGCPMELIHVLAKAAMQDQSINNDIDQLYQRCLSSTPIPRDAQQMNRTAATQGQVARTPSVASQSRPQQQPHLSISQYPVSRSSVIGSASTYHQSTASPAPSIGSVRGRSQVPQLDDSPESSGRASKRSRLSNASDIMIRCTSSSGREYEVPLRSVKDPLTIPQCPRPPRSTTQLKVPQKQGGSSNASRGCRTASNASPEDDDEPEPKEKPANYSKLLERTEKDLGWYGKYDNMSDQREQTMGIDVSIKIEGFLSKLRESMDKHKSFGNRVHVLTVMREILMAVCQTQGSRVGSEVRKSAYEYDDNMVLAIEKLTPGQRRKLWALDDGAWARKMQEFIDESEGYCFLDRLPEVLQLLNPNASSAEPDSDLEII